MRDRCSGHVPIVVLVENQERALWIGRESTHIGRAAAEQCFDHGGRGIADSDPNHFGWVTEEKTALMEIGILRDDSKAILCSMLPDDRVGSVR